MQIERNIYVLEDRTCVSQPIDYVQGTNAIPIIFHLRDYDIPDGAIAKIYIRKPSAKKEYHLATIDGNDIIVDIKDTMFSEVGMSYMQSCITYNEKTLVTFEYPVNVKRNNVSNGATESGDVDDYTDEILQKLNELSQQVSGLTLGMHTDGLIYIFLNGEPVGTGLNISGGTSDTGTSDDITVEDGVMTILTLANDPTQTDNVLSIA